MAKPYSDPVMSDRDGTSQRSRGLAALDPDHVLVDERSTVDLLSFARQYGSELKYFNFDNVESGDWSGFFDPQLGLDEIAAFMDHPERFSAESSPSLFRPHFVLFLTFLKLLRHAQANINGFGRRHLDFYFREFLRLATRPARPDRLNLLFDLAPGVEQASLPAGTLVTAGPDSVGTDRRYATDRDVVFSRAQIDALRSVHVARRITGLAEARDRHRNDPPGAAMAMLEIALGHPEPGDPLPPYPDRGAVDFDLLAELERLHAFAGSDLHMKFFEIQELMELLARRERDGAAEWARINALLEQAGRSRDAAFRLDPLSRDFEKNLVAAAGGEPPFSEVQEVKNVYDLFEQRTTRDARKFMREKLFFEPDDFVEMMQIKLTIDREWDGINLLLGTAGARLRADPDFRLTVANIADFPSNLSAALPEFGDSPPAAVARLRDYYAALCQSERYFFFVEPARLTHAESLTYLLRELTSPAAADRDWRRIDTLLVDVHRRKRHADRRVRLQEIHEETGFSAMIRYALGEPPEAPDDGTEVERLSRFLAGTHDKDLLERAGRETPGSADEWRSVYRVVEIAQRNHEAWIEPVPRREEWLNIYTAFDATTQTPKSLATAADAAQWRIFGIPQLRAQNAAPDPVLGWAYSSPLLALAEGTRAIRLTLGFDPRGFDADRLTNLFTNGSPLRFEVSTEKGWVEPDTVRTIVGEYADLKTLAQGATPNTSVAANALRFELTFSSKVDAIAAAPPDVSGFDGPWPVLRLMLEQVWNDASRSHETPYPDFQSLLLTAVHARVSVSGLRPSHLQNDEATLDPDKPFEPFGTSPAVGSRLLIGHPELVVKRLLALRYGVEWMGAPPDLNDYYANYGVSAPFTAALGLVDRKVEHSLEDAANLFGADDMSVEDVPSAMDPLLFRYERLAAAPTSEDLGAWDRYLQWELKPPDFQHQAYPRVASTKAIEMAAAIANRRGEDTIKPEKYKVNPPYTPKIKSLHVSYESEIEVEMTAAWDPSEQVLHVHPFGTCDAEAERTADGVPFVPRYENEGELYLGLRDVNPPQTVSILFQMAEGSADPDLESAAVRWSALSDDRWISLEGHAVRLDTTSSLRNSGIVELALPSARPSRRIAGDLYWLRASVARNSASVCDAVAIHAQAISATLVDNDNAPDHFAQPLPAGSVDALLEFDPRIAAVKQPYTSAGGRMSEQERAFNTRVSERLRHKQRAVTMWDYERLVLENFPEIYKVRCIPANAARSARNPGAVRVVVIPDVRKKLPFNPFGPKAPADLLASIQDYLDARKPPSAAVEVVNPDYVAVRVRLAVRFKAGGNEAYFKRQLEDELHRFLSPWAYDEGAEVVVAGKIYANSIVDFLDRRPYIDYIADLRLFTSDDGIDFRPVSETGEKSYFVSADRPDAVLVAARHHEFDLIPETGYERESLTGINFMKVELDFRVAEGVPGR